MLAKIYGVVMPNYAIHFGTKPEDYAGLPLEGDLSPIFTALQQHRGHSGFVKTGHLNVDFFLPVPGFIVEFDESQHFTTPRDIALRHYPAYLNLGFSRERWMDLCGETNAHDEDPPYRDEQRAWYDTLRDFMPLIMGFQTTRRLYSKDLQWCSLNPDKKEDVEKFRNILEGTGKVIAPVVNPTSPKNPMNEPPILDILVRFEYLTNKLKLQYLTDCTTGQFDFSSKYFQMVEENPKILNTGGKAFKAYFNIRFQSIGYLGPIFKGIDPWESEVVKELIATNDDLKKMIISSDNWFRLFCEFTLLKTSIHELIADIHDPENIDKYGYPDLTNLCKIESDHEVIDGAVLRDFVVNCLNLGIDPSEDIPGNEQSVGHLSHCKYAEFQARRSEWIQHAWHCINLAKTKMSTARLGSVMQWKKYSPCAYETGPVFIRKRKEFLLPAIARSFDTYRGWNQAALRNNVHEIIEKEIVLLIDSYWDYFEGRQTVEFFEGNHGIEEVIGNAGKALDRHYEALTPLSCQNGWKGSALRSFTRQKNKPDVKNYSKSEGSTNSRSAKQVLAERRYKLKPSAHGIPAGKYRPRFESVIQTYIEVIPDNFKRSFTSSKTNCVIRANDLPKDLHYEFCDWDNTISVELCLYRLNFPHLEASFRKLSNKQYLNLPKPVLKTQKNDWLRLLFHFPEEVPPFDIAIAMNVLIEQTYPEIKPAAV